MNEIVSVLFYLVWFLFWLFVGYTLHKILRKMVPANKESEKSNAVLRHIPLLKTEIHNGIIYAYNSSNDTFVSQGQSLDEVADVAYKFKKVDMALVNHLEYNFWFINGKVTPVNAKVL